MAQMTSEQREHLALLRARRAAEAAEAQHDRYTMGVTNCLACGTRRGVVTAQRTGPADDKNEQATRDRLTADLATAQARLDRQRKAIQATECRIAELSQKTVMGLL